MSPTCAERHRQLFGSGAGQARGVVVCGVEDGEALTARGHAEGRDVGVHAHAERAVARVSTGPVEDQYGVVAAGRDNARDLFGERADAAFHHCDVDGVGVAGRDGSIAGEGASRELGRTGDRLPGGELCGVAALGRVDLGTVGHVMRG